MDTCIAIAKTPAIALFSGWGRDQPCQEVVLAVAELTAFEGLF